MLTSAATPVETLLMLIPVTLGNRLSTASSIAFRRIVICAPTLLSVAVWVPLKMTTLSLSSASAVNVSGVSMVSPDRVPAHTPSGDRVSLAVASGSWWVPSASSPATLTVNVAMSA